MLVELRLENYAVIDNVAVAFASGLNLLTGETGAGKSILIDALTLLLGDKASTDVIRAGAERAVISAVFEVESAACKTVLHILEDNGLDAESESIILRREISLGGKGRVFVNNQPATVAVLKQLGPYLATVHAQNETLAAFDGPARLALLDAFAGSQLACVQDAFRTWKQIQTRIAIKNATSRIVCASWISGPIRSAKSKTLTCSPARMSGLRTRNASWPTPKKFITPP